jgi:hypothetical protein
VDKTLNALIYPSKGVANPDKITSHLIKWLTTQAKQEDFPVVKFSRYLYSFNNGVFFTWKKGCVWPDAKAAARGTYRSCTGDRPWFIHYKDNKPIPEYEYGGDVPLRHFDEDIREDINDLIFDNFAWGELANESKNHLKVMLDQKFSIDIPNHTVQEYRDIVHWDGPDPLVPVIKGRELINETKISDAWGVLTEVARQEVAQYYCGFLGRLGKFL